MTIGTLFHIENTTNHDRLAYFPFPPPLVQALTQEVTARQPQYDKVNSDGSNLLQLAHPVAVPVLQGKLQHLGRKWVDLRGRMGEQ